MRIKISRETSFAYSPPAKSVVQLLRLTPRSHEGQHVLRWRISADIDCVLRQSEDSLGNIVHTMSHFGPIDRLVVVAEGEVETFDTTGVVRGAAEPLLPEIYLRSSPLADANGALREFAETAAQGAETPLDKLHAVMGALSEAMSYDGDASPSPANAAEAFALRRGGARDYAHIFIACARWLGGPARYVSGYLLREAGATQEPGYAWAEAHLPVLGWIGFDAANCLCVDEGYVRVAVGLDYLSAAPSRGSRTGGGDETQNVALTIAQAQSQRQS
jgi:transglutaminase-like putative cysteine protease